MRPPESGLAEPRRRFPRRLKKIDYCFVAIVAAQISVVFSSNFGSIARKKVENIVVT